MNIVDEIVMAKKIRQSEDTLLLIKGVAKKSLYNL
jgi:hypothetical protein